MNDRGYYVFVLMRAGQNDAAEGPSSNEDIEESLALEGAHVDRFYRAPSLAGGVSGAMDEWPIVKERSFLAASDESEYGTARSVGIVARIFKAGDFAGFIGSMVGPAAER